MACICLVSWHSLFDLDCEIEVYGIAVIGDLDFDGGQTKSMLMYYVGIEPFL